MGYGPNPCECLDRVMEFEFCVLGNHDSSALFDPEGFNIAAEQAIFWTRTQMESGKDGPEASLKRMKFLCSLPRLVVENSGSTDDTNEAAKDDPASPKPTEGGTSIMFVHGSSRGPTNEYVFPEDTQNVKKMEKLFSLFDHLCFQGHTHVPGVFTSDLRFVRPVDTGSGFDISDPSQRLMVNVGSVGQPRDGDSRSCYVIHDGEHITFHRVEYDIEKNGCGDPSGAGTLMTC